MKLIFARSNAPGSIAIRTVTWSRWSHVAVVLPDGINALEAVWPRVVVTPVQNIIDRHTAHSFAYIDCPDDAIGIEWGLTQRGKPYDLQGVLGLGLHRDWQKDDAWWCSELAAMTVVKAGNRLFRDGSMHRVTQEHLWMVSK